jgi:hypothetical protein
MENIARLNSLNARMIADYASGLRGQGPEFLVGRRVPGGYHVEVVADHEPCSTETDVVVPIDTNAVRTDRPPVEKVCMEAAGHTVNLSNYDAVFWTESSVEKFLVPYLAAKYQWQAAAVLEMFARAWYGGVPHVLGETTDGTVGAPSEDVGVPFAVGHLPRSEYVIIGGEVEILFLHRESGVTAKPLSDYFRAPPADTKPRKRGSRAAKPRKAGR